MLDLTKPVQTRDGKPARIIASDIKGAEENRIVALVDHGDEEILAIRDGEGRVLLDGQEHPEDLINAPEVQYRAFDISCHRLGLPMTKPEQAARGYPWNKKILKFTVDHDGEVLDVSLVD